MSWVTLTFGSVFFFTSLYLFQKKVAVDSQNPRAMALLFNSSAALFAIILFFVLGSYKNFSLPAEPLPWIVLIIASFFYAMFERGRFIAAKLIDASVFTTIINVSVLVAFTGSFFLYSEAFTINKLLGGLLIVGSLFIVSLNKNRNKSSVKGLTIAIIASVMLGLAWMLDKLGTQLFNAETYNIFIWITPIIFIFFPYIKFEVIKSEFKIVTWKVLVLAGLNVIGYLMQLKALEIAEATRVIPLVQTYTLLTVFMGIILLKEREDIARKVVAGILAIIGAFLLASQG